MIARAESTTVGDRTDPDVAATRAKVAQVLWDAWSGREALTANSLSEISYSPNTFRAILRAAVRNPTANDRAVVSGLCEGSVEVSINTKSGLDIACIVNGNLTIEGRIEGDLRLHDGTAIQGLLTLDGKIGGDLTIFRGATVGRTFRLGGLIERAGDEYIFNTKASIDGNITIWGSLANDCYVNGRVGGQILIDGQIGGSLTVWETATVMALDLWSPSQIGGSVRVRGTVQDSVDVKGSVLRDLTASGSVGERLEVHIDATIGRRLIFTGEVGSIHLQGAIEGRTHLLPGRDTQIVPLVTINGARFGDEVTLGDRIDLSSCDMRQCADLDQLHLLGGNLFAAGKARLCDKAPSGEQIPPREMATLYRQLRTNLERRNNRPAAASFYTGEMDARLEDASSSGRIAEAAILRTYQVMSGYGLKPLRTAVWFVLLALVGTELLLIGEIDLDPARAQVAADGETLVLNQDLGSRFEALTFSVRSMVSFFSPPVAELRPSQEWIQIGLRATGPVFLTQLILGIRERVAR